MFRQASSAERNHRREQQLAISFPSPFALRVPFPFFCPRSSNIHLTLSLAHTHPLNHFHSEPPHPMPFNIFLRRTYFDQFSFYSYSATVSLVAVSARARSSPATAARPAPGRCEQHPSAFRLFFSFASLPRVAVQTMPGWRRQYLLCFIAAE